MSPATNQHDAIDAIELALDDDQAMSGHLLAERCSIEERTDEVLPVVTIVTDHGGPFRSFSFEAFIAGHRELHHVRTRVRIPGRNGSRERHDIRHGLPAQPPPLRTTPPARVSPSVYACGDHRDTASIQGAFVSGHRVAGAVLTDLA